MTDETKGVERKNGVLLFVVAASLLWLVTCAVLFGISKPCRPDASDFLTARVTCLSANEMGDFLAGAFAPLAFLWLIAAVFLQRDELAAQRQELRDSRQVAKAQVDLISAQTTILDDERTRAVQRETDEDMMELAALAVKEFSAVRHRFYVHDGPLYESVFGEPPYKARIYSSGGANSIEAVSNFISSIVSAIATTHRIIEEGGDLTYGDLELLEGMIPELDQMILLAEDASPPMKASFRRTYIPEGPEKIRLLATILRERGTDTKHAIYPAPEKNQFKID